MVRLNLPKERKFQAAAVAWKRIVAFLIDIFIIDLVLLWPFQGIIEKIMPFDAADVGSIKSMEQFFMASPNAADALGMMTIAIGLLVVLYFALMEYKTGQTIGKMLLNIYVISDTGEKAAKPGFWQCVFRSIVWLPMFPFIVFWVIDPLYALFNQKSQRLLELISKTKTVEDYMGI